MTGAELPAPGVPGEPCKLITAVVPDDGADLALMKALRTAKGVIRANSTSSLVLPVLKETKTRPGKLPEPLLARVIQVLVPEAYAEAIFEFVCQHAGIEREQGGIVMQTPAPFCSTYELPEGVPDEPE
jgi:hypothetical protein